MKYFLPFILGFLLLASQGMAQHSFMVGGALYGGIPFNSYEQNRKVLGSKWNTTQVGVELNAQYRIFNRLSVEAGVRQNAQYRKLRDKDFEERNEGFTVNLTSSNSYWSWYSALQYNQPLPYSSSSLYGKVGYCFNNFGKAEKAETGNFIITDEDVSVTNAYQDKNESVFIEAGLETSLSDNVLWHFGLRFNKGLSEMLSANYQVQKNNNILSTDGFSSDGTYLALNTGLRIMVFHRSRRKSVRRIKENPLVEEEKIPADLPEHRIEGRELVVKKSISVAKPDVVIRVWDDQKVDGDIVSINLNSSWILEDYTLGKDKKELNVNLVAGTNTLVLHAKNLGKISPNTAAVSVDDGHKVQKLVLSSDFDESGTLLIEYKPVSR